MSSLDEFAALLDETMLVDRHRLRRKLQQLRASERSGKPFDLNLARCREELDASRQTFLTRQSQHPQIYYDSALPITARHDEIAAAIREHRVIVICGETGSGKSTQLPKLCLELGRGIAGMIGHTQPRRIAARTIASRVAEELRVPLGREVGYQVRFTDATGPQTLIKLMTDGLLLAETQTDRWLNRYDTLIIDEAHERSLNIDFLLGYLHQLITRRSDLKLIITSATIDAERFAEHFRAAVGTVPIIEVSGRMYPVEIRYRPLLPDEQGEDPDPQEALAAAIREVSDTGPGNVLVFLPTERDIHDTMKTLKGRTFAGIHPELLPLYARLPVKDQQRVFEAHGPRRIVLTTNVAESSLTVPGIRYVVDTGTARISRYSPRSKLQRLPIESVSRASADQRAGRCGRVGPGICVRLYAEEDYQQREAYTPPEILRSNLAAVILQLEALGLGAVESFPFLDPPKAEAVRDGYKTLFEIGAVDGEQKLTPLGRTLHRLPVDPRIARIIVAGEQEHCLEDILIIAAAMEVQDPRDRPLEKQQLADEAHARFADPESDFLGYLRLWDFFHKLKDELTRGQLRKACQQNFLSYLRMKEWLDVHRELVEIVRTSGIRERRGPKTEPCSGPKSQRTWEGPFDPAKYAAIHRALLTGLLSGVAMRTETGEYLVAGGAKSSVWPGSGLASKAVKWVVSAEQVETGRRYIRTVGRIDPAWIEPLASHLIQRSYSEPHWDAEALATMATEKVHLLGLPIVPRRRTRYQRIDPQLSRQLFIREGLVHGQWPEPPPFLQENLELIRRVTELQARARQPAVLRDDTDLEEFYAQQIPSDICDGRSLVQWWQSQRKTRPQLLRMTEADVLSPQAELASAELYPEALRVRQLQLPLVYQHDPGSDSDGVTIRVPQPALNQLETERLGWLVPGLLEDKVLALLKSLPKALRRELVPLPDIAKQVTARLRFGEGALPQAISRALEAVCGAKIPATAFDESRLPAHLRLRIEVLGQNEETLATGRDLPELQQKLGAQAAAQFSSAPDPRWNQEGLRTWSFGPLPTAVPIQRGGLTLTGYPTLIDQGTSVGLRLLDSAVQSQHELRFGLRRLFCLAVPRELKQQVDHLPHLNSWVLSSKTMPQPFPVREQLLELIAERAFLTRELWPRTQADFGLAVATGKPLLPTAAAEVVRAIQPLFESYGQIRKIWQRTNHPQFASTRQDIHDQLSQLLRPGFLSRIPWPWLIHLPRYLRAIVRRLDKLTAGGGPRDLQQLPTVLPLWNRWKEREQQCVARGQFDPELETYRWMLEEFRVHVFAQELGTAVSVSQKRLDKQWTLVNP
ncbi:ATP-dependent RNA helicase HrpA [bacterium]|nr:ATP-dependent RNA helicase HrpA [bacterium]